MDVHYKTVGVSELEFNRIASLAEISPEIMSIEIDKKGYILGTRKYTPFIELSMRERKIFRQQIKDLLYKLHDLGIYHGDLTENNIVVDLSHDEIFLIDFGRSKFIEDITDDDLKENIFGEESENLEDFLSAEIEQVDFFLSLTD